MDGLHLYLARQLHQLELSSSVPPALPQWKALLESVSRAYGALFEGGGQGLVTGPREPVTASLVVDDTSVLVLRHSEHVPSRAWSLLRRLPDGALLSCFGVLVEPGGVPVERIFGVLEAQVALMLDGSHGRLACGVMLEALSRHLPELCPGALLRVGVVRHEVRTGLTVVSAAGVEAPVHFTPTRCSRVEVGGAPLGRGPHSYPEAHCLLAPGDVLVWPSAPPSVQVDLPQRDAQENLEAHIPEFVDQHELGTEWALVTLKHRG